MSEPDLKEQIAQELERRKREAQYAEFFLGPSYRRKRLLRRITLTLVTATAIALSSYLLVFEISEFGRLPLVVTLAGAFAGFAFYYLRPSSVGRYDSASSRDNESDRARAFVDSKLFSLLEKLDATSGSELKFTAEDKSQILTNIQVKLESEALEKYFASLRELVAGSVRQEALDDRFQSTRRRLGQATQDLAKRGNLNLIIGILTTIGGLGVLAYAVFNIPHPSLAPELLAYFVPRVALVILIEVFAYFFLRLYKQSLTEIKYFQNEITNVEAKHMALQVALRSGEPSLLSKTVEVLVNTERNFVLAKDQTTVDLERERIGQKGTLAMLDLLKDTFKAREKT